MGAFYRILTPLELSARYGYTTTHRSRERFSHRSWKQSASCREWAVYITITNE